MSTKTRIFRISISERKGTQKTNIAEAKLKDNYGIIGDAHAGSRRQVSLLPFESYAAFLASRGDISEINPGDFAENITTIGLSFVEVKVGRRIRIGDGLELEVTEIGKSECHNGCHIRKKVGDCIMPREGIFAKVIRGGAIKEGDKIAWSRDVL